MSICVFCDWLFTALSLVVSVYYVGYMCLSFVTVIFGYFQFYNWKPVNIQRDLPGVSIIKPIVGKDAKLKENLESYFKLNYPKYEILICIGEASNPPSLPLIQELMDTYPLVDVRLFIGAKSVGVNPKINNMITAYESAQYELIWISDANILTQPDTLTEMVCKVQHPNVGLVHQMPYVHASSPVTFPDYLEKVYFGTQHCRIYLLANIFNQNCANGMSWVIKKSVLEGEGGLIAFCDYLAEDFFMGKCIHAKGWKLALSSRPALQNPGTRSFSSFRSRLMRWGSLRAAMMPVHTLTEPFTECFMLGLVACLSIHYITGWNIILLAIVHLMMWFTSDMIMMHIIENGPITPLWKILAMWCIREFSALPLYLACVRNREIEWRGNKFKIQFGGKTIKTN